METFISLQKAIRRSAVYNQHRLTATFYTIIFGVPQTSARADNLLYIH